MVEHGARGERYYNQGNFGDAGSDDEEDSADNENIYSWRRAAAEISNSEGRTVKSSNKLSQKSTNRLQRNTALN